jgi:signal transduction histidine kinase
MRAMLLLLTFVILLPLLVVQSAIYGVWFYSHEREEEENNREVAELLATAFSDYLKDIRRQELALGAGLTELIPYSSAQANQFLVKTTSESPAVFSWRWLSPEGKVIAATESPAIGREISDRVYFHEVIGGKPWTLSELIKDRLTGKPTFVVARRIESEGKLRGVVTASVDIHRMAEALLPFRHVEDASLTIFDRNGLLVCRAPRDKSERENCRDDDPLLNEVLANHKPAVGLINSSTDREGLIAARVPVGDTGWVVGADRPFRVAMAGIYRSLFAALGWNLLVILASLGGAILFSRRLMNRLRELQAHAVSIGQGDLDHRAEVTGVREFSDLAHAFNRMAHDLKQARQEQDRAQAELEDRVRQRTAELASAVARLEAEVGERELAETRLRESHAALEQTTSRLRALAAELTQTGERERHRLASVLHDHLQQLLVAARMRIDRLRAKTEEPSLLTALQETNDYLQQAIAESRSLAVELSPSVLYDEGLIAALRWLACRTQQQHNLSVEVNADGSVEPLPEPVKILLFQAARELLFNVVKHARTHRAVVELISLDAAAVSLKVIDFGVGFDPAGQDGKSPKSFGLFSIRQQLELLGGRFEVQSAVGQGTCVTLVVPRQSAAEAHVFGPADRPSGQRLAERPATT